jgi:hypothetical protein
VSPRADRYHFLDLDELGDAFHQAARTQHRSTKQHSLSINETTFVETSPSVILARV